MSELWRDEHRTHIDSKGRKVKCRRNDHPTVKPLSLFEWIVRLVRMPERNLVLDPFAGTGTTALACIREGLPVIAIEKDAHSFDILRARVEATIAGIGPLFNQEEAQ